jgi:hypothetical protein
MGFCDTFEISDTNDADVMAGPANGFKNGTVPLGEGRPFFVGFTDDYVDFYIRYVGHFWTKQSALINMAVNYAYFPRVDADTDYRTFDVGWYRLFPREVSQLYYNLITQNDIALGGFLDDDGNYVRPDIIPTSDSIDTTGMTRVLPQIAINHNYYGYLLANIFLASPTDDQMDFTKTMQIAIDGATDDTRAFDDAEARDVAAGCVIGTSLDADGEVSTPFSPPECKTVLSFTHPVTGITVRGLKVGEFPVAFDLIKRLNLLKDRFERVNTCQGQLNDDPSGDTIGDAYCSCVTNIGYAREDQSTGGEFVSTCADDYYTVTPGKIITVDVSPRIAVDVESLDIACTAQDLRNRVESAREGMDDLLDYVNDLRTYNKYINNF